MGEFTHVVCFQVPIKFKVSPRFPIILGPCENDLLCLTAKKCAAKSLNLETQKLVGRSQIPPTTQDTYNDTQ